MNHTAALSDIKPSHLPAALHTVCTLAYRIVSIAYTHVSPKTRMYDFTGMHVAGYCHQ